MDEMRARDLDLENLVGQGYDGASAMSGAFNGAHAVICSEYPLATYVHCSNHVLNLCLSHGSSEQAVRNAIYGNSFLQPTSLVTLPNVQLFWKP